MHYWQSEIEVNTVEYGDIVTLYYPTLKCYLAMIGACWSLEWLRLVRSMLVMLALYL